MKTKFFAVFAFAVLFGFNLSATTLNSPIKTGGDPTEVRAVISAKRIWLVADEMPVKCLKTQVIDEQGKVVLERCFSSKCSEWYLNIEALPKGTYTLRIGAEQVQKFKK